MDGVVVLVEDSVLLFLVVCYFIEKFRRREISGDSYDLWFQSIKCSMAASDSSVKK